MLPLRAASLPLATVLVLLLAGCASPTTPPSGPAGSPRLLLGTEAAFPPFEDVDATTQVIVGFDIDVAKAIAAHMGRTPEFRNLKFDALIPSVQNGQIDGAISAITINDARKQQVDFSLPYYVANQSVTVPGDDSTIRGADDLANKTIGVQLGTTAETWLVEHFVQKGRMSDGDLKRYDSFPLAIEALKRGDVAAVMMDAPAQKDAVRTGGGAIRLAFEVPTGEEYGLAVRKGNSAVLLGINDGLRALASSGELQQLKDRWGV